MGARDRARVTFVAPPFSKVFVSAGPMGSIDTLPYATKQRREGPHTHRMASTQTAAMTTRQPSASGSSMPSQSSYFGPVATQNNTGSTTTNTNTAITVRAVSHIGDFLRRRLRTGGASPRGSHRSISSVASVMPSPMLWLMRHTMSNREWRALPSSRSAAAVAVSPASASALASVASSYEAVAYRTSSTSHSGASGLNRLGNNSETRPSSSACGLSPGSVT